MTAPSPGQAAVVDVVRRRQTPQAGTVVTRRAASAGRLYTALDRLEARVTEWLARYGIPLLRVGLSVVFFWFGVLKFFPGMSPGEGLAVRTIDALTVDLVPPQVSLPLLAATETLIGLGLIGGICLRVTLLVWVDRETARRLCTAGYRWIEVPDTEEYFPAIEPEPLDQDDGHQASGSSTEPNPLGRGDGGAPYIACPPLDAGRRRRASSRRLSEERRKQAGPGCGRSPCWRAAVGPGRKVELQLHGGRRLGGREWSR